MSYYILSVVYTWFIVGAFCLALSVALKNDVDKDGNQYWVNGVLMLIYVSVLIVIFITSLGVKPRRVEDFYKGLAFILGCYQFYILYLVLKFCIISVTKSSESEGRMQVAVTLGSTFGLLAFIVLINCEVITILRGVVHYVFLIPTYVNIFFIYSICNVHDCTWGNRPDALTAEEKERLEEFEEFRTRWAILWALSNSGFAYVINEMNNAGSEASYFFLAGVSLAGVGVIILRVFGGFFYLFDECCKREMKKSENCVVPDAPFESFGKEFVVESASDVEDDQDKREEVLEKTPDDACVEPAVKTVFTVQVGKEDEGDKKERRRRKEEKRRRREKKKKAKEGDKRSEGEKKKRSRSKKREKDNDDNSEGKKGSKEKDHHKLPPIVDDGQTRGESKFDIKDFSGFDMIGQQVDKEML
jgi:hypothetical protein